MVLSLAPGCRWAQAWCLVWMLVWGSTAAATTEPRDMAEAGPRLHFDLPSQPLQKALADFGGLTGHSVLVDSTLTQGRTAQAVRGVFAAQEALRLLLAGTGLHARYSGRDAFTLVPEPATAEVPMPEATTAPGLGGVAPSAAADFAGALQSAITQALCAAQPHSFGRYRAALQLWTGPEGRIRRASLLEPSGEAARDAELLARLRGLAIGRVPPPGLAQPLTVLLSPRADPVAVCRAARADGG
ncbi:MULTISPECIES: STN domain-containing protein [unclassified Variovorax]|uniref:STN domain-containing protein n=1 Tax=unclassified Variovorax TaxID=663243 RepID=UPI0025779FC1|nr:MULTISPECIES: STN domain-containing protein [unclassified Variovorax]MDM0089965.1 STN domain-containing protein [Variovorax sp. J22G40]MDM0148369.1 STN domain-containing protein [Variovorax sp. J2P1-31]